MSNTSQSEEWTDLKPEPAALPPRQRQVPMVDVYGFVTLINADGSPAEPQTPTGSVSL